VLEATQEKRLPKEKWLRNLRDIYLKLGNTTGAVNTMRQLAFFYGDKDSIAWLKKYSGGLEPLLDEPAKKPKIGGDMDVPRYDPEIPLIASLEKLLRDRTLTPFERATAWYSWAEINSGESAGYPLIIYALEQARRQPEIPRNVNAMLARLYFNIRDHDKAIVFAKLALQEMPEQETDFWETPDRRLSLLKVLCYANFSTRRFPESVDSCQRFMAESEQAGLPLTEDFLRTLSASYYQTGDRQNHIRIRKRLVELYPNERNIKYLAKLEAEAEN
jgi:tetratricopeptide (TPR) repeat protein